MKRIKSLFKRKRKKLNPDKDEKNISKFKASNNIGIIRKAPHPFLNSKGVKYYLHFKDVKLRGGRTQRIYFFARDIRSGMLDEVPAGYKVMETERTGMPILKKS